MDDKLRAENSRTVQIKDVHGRWTFLAKLTYIPNTQGVPPKSPTPHFPPLPVRSMIGAVEDMLTGHTAEAGVSGAQFEVELLEE